MAIGIQVLRGSLLLSAVKGATNLGFAHCAPVWWTAKLSTVEAGKGIEGTGDGGMVVLGSDAHSAKNIAVDIRLLKNSLPLDTVKRTTYLGYVHRGLDLEMVAIADAVEAQAGGKGMVNGGTVIISSGLHSSRSCAKPHITGRIFDSRGLYAAGVHFFETDTPTFRLAANDAKNSKWKNKKLKIRLPGLESWVGHWPIV